MERKPDMTMARPQRNSEKTPTARLCSHLNAWRPRPDEEKKRIQSLFTPQSLDAGQFFLCAGDLQHWIGFNLQGVLRYFYIDHLGRERNKHFCLENDWAMSLTAFLEAAPALFYIQALESVEMLCISTAAVRDLLGRSVYWRAYYRHLLERSHAIKETGEARFLMNDALGRYHAFLQDFPGLPDRIRQHHIAAYLGISSVSLSRLRRGLAAS
jgi:CRP-like cAMP-binding protein